MNEYLIRAWADFNAQYWRLAEDRPQTLKIIAAFCGSVALIALTAFLLYP